MEKYIERLESGVSDRLESGVSDRLESEVTWTIGVGRHWTTWSGQSVIHFCRRPGLFLLMYL